MIPNDPPYTPSFGISPPVLAGRDEVLAETMAALRAGPRHPRFGYGLMGNRGVGKTAVLDAIGERVRRELGWPVLHRQVMGDMDLLADISAGLVESLSPWAKLGRDYRQLEKQLGVGVNLGVVSAQASVRSVSEARDTAVVFKRLVHEAGVFARDHGSGLLVTIDEAMSSRTNDLAVLAGVIQTEVNRALLPVSFVLAGLPTLRQALVTASGTFPNRLYMDEVRDLSPGPSRLALLEPAAQLGVTWQADALDLVVERSGGHPYYVQLFGYHTWVAGRRAPDVLTLAHAQAGVQAGEVVVRQQFDETWARLRPQEQAVLSAVAALGPGPVTVQAVARALERSAEQLDVARSRLVYRHGLLSAPGRGLVDFPNRQLADWVRGSHGQDYKSLVAPEHRALPRRPPHD
jgi:hypothetical protein